jgi:hypothetical protein
MARTTRRHELLTSSLKATSLTRSLLTMALRREWRQLGGHFPLRLLAGASADCRCNRPAASPSLALDEAFDEQAHVPCVPANGADVVALLVLALFSGNALPLKTLWYSPPRMSSTGGRESASAHLAPDRVAASYPQL